MQSEKNSKIVNCLSLFIGFFSLALSLTPNSSLFYTKLIVGIACLVLLVFFVQFKKKYEKIYNLLLSLAKNNKLHPIREFIMILDKNRNLHSQNYLFKIEKLIFTYKISSPSKDNGAHDVNYKIAFQIRVSLIDKIFLYMTYLKSHKSPQLCFYRICENNTPILKNVKIEQMEYKKAKFKQATLNGPSGDRSKEFGGLFECSNLEIPIDIIWEHKHLNVTIEYLVENQIIQQANQYTFVIISENYGKKVDEIQMKIEGNLKSKPILQCYSPSSPYYNETIQQFEGLGNYKYQVTFKPSKMCVYIAQINL